MEFIYFNSDYAIKEHDFIIAHSGGKSGILNYGLLESVLAHIQNDVYYPDMLAKTTHLFYSINKNHAFNDGNKRTAIVLAAYFLELNGYDYRITRLIREMENTTVHVANNIIDKALLSEIMQSILYEEEYTEELQLKIMDALRNATFVGMVEEPSWIYPDFY